MVSEQIVAATPPCTAIQWGGAAYRRTPLASAKGGSGDAPEGARDMRTLSRRSVSAGAVGILCLITAGCPTEPGPPPLAVDITVSAMGMTTPASIVVIDAQAVGGPVNGDSINWSVVDNRTGQVVGSGPHLQGSVDLGAFVVTVVGDDYSVDLTTTVTLTRGSQQATATRSDVLTWPIPTLPITGATPPGNYQSSAVTPTVCTGAGSTVSVTVTSLAQLPVMMKIYRAGEDISVGLQTVQPPGGTLQLTPTTDCWSVFVSNANFLGTGAPPFVDAVAPS